MIRRPPRSTRTDTLFPYTTLFRSGLSLLLVPVSRTVQRPARLALRIDLEPVDPRPPGRTAQRSAERCADTSTATIITSAGGQTDPGAPRRQLPALLRRSTVGAGTASPRCHSG